MDTRIGKIESAIFSLIEERRDFMKRIAAIEAELARYGVSLVDQSEGTAWSLHGIVSKETAAFKNG